MKKGFDMVRIISTHAIVGDQRTPEMYGWFGANPEIGLPNRTEDTQASNMRRNERRRQERAKQRREKRKAESLESYLAKFSGEEAAG